MAWFGEKLVRWPFGGGSTAVVERDADVSDENSVLRPSLIMLAADASGLASFKLNRFGDTGAAVDFIKRSYGDRSDTGLIAFWATTERPVMKASPGTDAVIEAVVLIRQQADSGVVYPFSFVDIPAAMSFIRYEMGRGLDSSLVLVYWAAPVQLVITGQGDVDLYPAVAPSTTAEQFEPAPMTERVNERVATRKPTGLVLEPVFVSTEDDPIELLFRQDDAADATPDQAMATEMTAEEVVEIEAPAEAPVEFAQGMAVEAGDQAGSGDETGEPEAEPAPATEVAAEAAGEQAMDVDETQDETAGVDLAEPIEAAGEPATVTVKQPAAAAAETMGAEFPAGRASADIETFRPDANQELQKVLRVRRWEEQTEPFSGFRSPPGRF